VLFVPVQYYEEQGMLYASLTGPLLGLYYPLPTDDKEVARVMLSTSSLKQLWCSIYTETEAQHCVAKYSGMLLPEEYAKRLDYHVLPVHADV
jgi:hypothetical protein